MEFQNHLRRKKLERREKLLPEDLPNKD